MGKRLEDLDLSDEPLAYTGRITTARGRLAAFLSGLSPKTRRLLVGEGLTGWEAIDWYDLTDKQRGAFEGGRRGGCRARGGGGFVLFGTGRQNGGHS